MSTSPQDPDVPTRQHRRTRRLHRFLTLVTSAGVVALVAVGGVGTAQANSVDGQPYTADDGCYYFVQDGQWVGGSCVVTYVDAAGAAVDGVLSVHAYDPAATGHLGKLVMQLDVRDPAYVAYRDPNDPAYDGGVWARQLRGAPASPVEVTVWDDSTGSWRWQVLPAAPSAAADAGVLGGGGVTNGSTFVGGGGWGTDVPVGGGGTVTVGGGSHQTTGILELDQLMADANQDLIDIILSPNCGSDHIWCHD